MIIPFLIEPNLKDTIWCNQVCSGIESAIAERGYEAFPLDGKAYQSFDYKSFFKGEPPLLLLFGTSPSWLLPAIQFFFQNDIGIILLGKSPLDATELRGQITFNFEKSILQLLDYLASCNCNKTALYGVFQNSTSDLIKQKTFLKHLESIGTASPENYVFENKNNLDECYNQFFKHISEFDSAICVNEIVAASLSQKLQADGIRIPKDFQILTYGSSNLTLISNPPLSTYITDHSVVASQAIRLYKFLRGSNTPDMHVSIQISGTIVPRKSTIPPVRSIFSSKQENSLYNTQNFAKSFYNDHTVTYFSRFEQFLQACDIIDIEILRKILQKIPYEKIAEELHMARNTIIYRLNKIQNTFSVNSKKELITFLQTNHFDEIILSNPKK